MIEIKDKVKANEHALHQTIGLVMLSTTGLKHLNHQIVDDYNPIKFHELNAKLEEEIRSTFSGDYILRIGDNTENLAMFLQYVEQFETLRDSFVTFVKGVNSGK